MAAMTGKTIVDGVDIFTQYGAYLTFGSYEGLVQFPRTKSVNLVSWREVDGDEADLSELHFDSRSITLNFAIRGDYSAIEAFYSWIGNNPYRVWNIVPLGVSLPLRLASMSGLDTAITLHSFSALFYCDQSLLDSYTYQAPSSSITGTDTCKLDGVLLSSYGVRVARGTANSAAFCGAVKPLLARNISTVDGTLYDEGEESDAQNTFASRDITLQCNITAPSATLFWRNWKALFYNLTKQNGSATYVTDKCARQLYIDSVDDTFKCFYKECSVSNIVIGSNGGVWVDFSLTFHTVR